MEIFLQEILALQHYITITQIFILKEIIMLALMQIHIMPDSIVTAIIQPVQVIS